MEEHGGLVARNVDNSNQCAKVKAVARENESSDDSSEYEVDYDQFIGTIEESDTLHIPAINTWIRSLENYSDP